MVSPQGEEIFLQLSCHPRFPFVILNDSIKRQQNSTTVLEELLALRISDLQIMPGERILRMDFDDSELKLIIHLFTSNSNFFIVGKNHLIINSFKKSKALKQTTYSVPENSQVDITSLSSSQFSEMVKSDAEKPLSKFLKKNFFHLNQTVTSELLYWLKIPMDAAIKNLENGQLAKLHAGFIDFLKECEQGQPHIYFKEKLPHVLSLTHLGHLADFKNEIFEDINTALRIFNFQSLKYQTLVQKKNSYTKSINQRIQYLERTLKKLEERQDQSSKKDYYQRIGELILAQPQAIQLGKNTCQLTDFFDPETPTIQINIHPQLNAQENAEVFFQKAKNFDQKQLKRKQRAEELQVQVEKLHRLKENLDSIDSYKALEKIEAKLKSENLLQKSEAEASQLRLPYKKFSSKNWEIWVGRSSRDNDAMTFKHAHKEDWWLHVQGYSGSHVVIRNPQHKDNIQPDILEYAASLAITHSDAKHASYVPVVYTKVKYVRKPHKSAPGTVIPNRTKTIYADPIEDF